MFQRRSFLLAGLGMVLVSAITLAADPPAGPAYQIVPRSRVAEVVPTDAGNAQTAGGAMLLEQPEPNTVVITLTGSAVAGSHCKGSFASLQFNVEQDLEIVPTRAGVRPPRVGMVGRVVGTLQVSEKGSGTAEQSAASASLLSEENVVLSINVQPSSVAGCGQKLALNHRDGPREAVVGPGCYHLRGTFQIGASQGKGLCHQNYAVADFDPAPQFDSIWNDALKPFRAIPRKDFGFKVVLRVVEDSGAPADGGK